MHSSLNIPGKPMSPKDINGLLKRSELVVGHVTWHRTGDDENAIAEYEGIIFEEKMFLHLMSQEMTNYWIVTWPESSLKLEDGIRLIDYDLESITMNAEKCLNNRLGLH